MQLKEKSNQKQDSSPKCDIMLHPKIETEQWWRDAVINRRAWTWEDAHNMQHHGEWWQHAVIYQISPMSFFDTDGNGAGDLNGIIEKLDYIASLGVDAIWLCPIYESPMTDFGYDVTDMRKIDSLFGNIEDFDRLLDVAHTMGLKILVDQIWNHTSEKHPWFIESSQGKDNPKADWYVWADPKPDGSPPNNWLSAFMGRSAWQWSPQRGQFYFYNFLPSQPELNWHNPDVIDAVLKRARFWLERGVDGFRIDAPNFFLHDPQLRDNPARPEDAPRPDGVDPDNPIVRQMFEHNFCLHGVVDKLKPIRDLVNEYPGVMTLGEVTFCEDTVKLASEYVGPDRLHMAYHSALLTDEPMSADLMRRTMSRVKKHFTQGGDCWMVGNHDYGRLKSHWRGMEKDENPYSEEFYKLMAALLLCLPGAYCLYQGDELGLPEARIPEDIPVEKLQDPFGKALYPSVVGRDGSRTPMPWKADQPNAGFTTAEEPWLPIPQDHIQRSIDVQTQDPKSTLNAWRRLLHWRRKQPALAAGNFEMLDTEEPIFAFTREYAEQRLLCIFNLSPRSTEFELSDYRDRSFVKGLGFEFEVEENSLKLPGHSCFFANLPVTSS